MRELAKHNSSLLFEKEPHYTDKMTTMPQGIQENDGKNSSEFLMNAPQ
jgi:hypothetical protein